MKRIHPQMLFGTFVFILGAPILVKLLSFSMENSIEGETWLNLTFLGIIMYLTVYYMKFKVRIYALNAHDSMDRQRHLLLKIKKYIHGLPEDHILHTLLHDLSLFGRLLIAFLLIDIVFFFLEWSLFLFLSGLIFILIQMTVIMADSLRYHTMKEMGVPETRDGHFLV